MVCGSNNNLYYIMFNVTRIADLVKPDQPARLSHPICGLVEWAERSPGEGLILFWGRKRGRRYFSVHDSGLWADVGHAPKYGKLG